MPASTEQGASASHRRITKDQETDLVDRLYRNSLEQKQRKLKELDARYYPVQEEKKISKEELAQSAERQVDVEMKRRRERQEANDRQFVEERKKTTRTTKISPEEQEASVKHLYEDTLARKKANLEESRKRYEFDPEKAHGKPKRLPPDEFKASVDRMSQPKKTEFTIAEVNKIYGL